MVATLLIVIGCILAPLSVAAVWAKNQVTDTDRYVATVTPLASDPAIQNAVADKITTEIFARLDVQGITNQAVDALAERGLPPLIATQLHALSEPLASGVQSFVRDEVGKFVASDAFKDAWVTANRAAHQALVAAMTGQTGEGITIANDTVSINLGPFIQVVKQRLVDRGFDLASRIPDINPSFTILQSDLITKAQGAFRLLNALGNWLPVVALILLALGVYVAKGHRRALLGAGLGLAGSMVALALGIFFVRTIYLNALPLGVLDREAAGSFYDTLVRFLRLGLRTVLVLGLVVALGAFLTGTSVTAVRTRTALSRGIGGLRGGAERAGFRTGPVGAWVYRYLGGVYRYKRVGDLDGFLCSIVMQSGMPRASKDLACKIFKQIEPAENQTGKQPTSRQAATRQSPSLSRIEQRSTQQYVDGDGSSLSSLMGGGA